MRFLLSAILLLLGGPAAAAPFESAEFTYKDWRTYCSPRHGCEAYSSVPEGGSNTGYMSLYLNRGWGRDDAPVLKLSYGQPASERTARESFTLTLSVPDQNHETRIASSDLKIGEYGGIELSGAQSESLILAMINGEAVKIDIAFKDTSYGGTISLAGISAMLRWVDDFQGRANTTTAIVARGSATMEEPISLVIYPKSIADLPQKVHAAWVNTGVDACSELDEGLIANVAEGYMMHDQYVIWLLPCGYPGAYNYPMVVVIESDGEVFEGSPIRFATPGGGEGRLTTTLALYNLSFDPATGELASFFKGRGIGDCGLYQIHVWDGIQFGLEEARLKDDCDGQHIEIDQWPLLFSAKDK